MDRVAVLNRIVILDRVAVLNQVVLRDRVVGMTRQARLLLPKAVQRRLWDQETPAEKLAFQAILINKALWVCL
jgi:hypothetical protein